MTSPTVPYSFASSVRRWARERPDAPAVTGDDVCLTYRELDALSGRLAVALRERGIGVGDRVAYLGRNRLAFVVVLVAASKAGGVTTALNWRLAGGELAPVLDDSEPSVVFLAEEFATVYADASRERECTPGVRSFPVVLLPDGPGIDAIERVAGDRGGLPDTDHVPGPDDLAVLTYTSGTTGAPKGVMLAYRQIEFHAAIETPWRVGPDSTLLVVSPVFHAAGVGWLFLATFHGSHTVLLPDADPRFVTEGVRRHAVTDALLVPALLRTALADPDFVDAARRTLRTVVYGASAISPTLLEQALGALPECSFVQGYGMSETTGPVTCLYPSEHRAGGPALASAGTPLPGIEIRIVDPTTGVGCDDGEVGEIWTRSRQNCVGYWRRPEATAELFHEDWLRTGDAGMIRDGYVYVTDRIKDMIDTGGENVYAGEVERAIARLDGVDEVCVVGVPDDRWGETVCAVIVRTPGTTLDAGAVIAGSRELLAHYKCPTIVRFVDELPRNAAGKVLRREVRSGVVR